MAANPRDLLIRPIITEKTSVMMQENKYTFQVPLDANKVEIRQAVEAIFGVKVLSVNTIRVLGKTKRMGMVLCILLHRFCFRKRIVFLYFHHQDR